MYPDPDKSIDNIIKVMDYAKENNMIIVVVQHTATSGDTFSKIQLNGKFILKFLKSIMIITLKKLNQVVFIRLI